MIAGISQAIEESIPLLGTLAIRCNAHGLQLTVNDAIKDVVLLRAFDNLFHKACSHFTSAEGAEELANGQRVFFSS